MRQMIIRAALAASILISLIPGQPAEAVALGGWAYGGPVRVDSWLGGRAQLCIHDVYWRCAQGSAVFHPTLDWMKAWADIAPYGRLEISLRATKPLVVEHDVDPGFSLYGLLFGCYYPSVGGVKTHRDAEGEYSWGTTNTSVDGRMHRDTGVWGC